MQTTQQQDVSQVFRIGTIDREGLFVEVTLKDAYGDSPALSIMGWTQLRRNTDWSSGGQIVSTLLDPAVKPYGDWTKADIHKLAFVWRLYHLNTMQAACEHQREDGWQYSTHTGKSCPFCGYQIGSAWLSKPIPADVLEYVRGLLDV